MKITAKILTVLISLALFSCEVSKSDTEGYIDKFYSNKIAFEKVAEKIYADKELTKRTGRRIPENKIDPEIKNDLEKLGIESFTIYKANCKKDIEVEFILNWTKNATLYLVKNNCNFDRSKIGYHSKTTMIEVWGLGNGWIMWIDYDFI
ncbi:hypothetical protein DBB36_19435 [Flavobacterium sp. WLB]|uniref:hypothetical protein n=1 Tax=unclassified Flavobacterium TaxID=196869 RepID=UPI0006ABAF9A|nr:MULTISPECIES: hypothetical protein [unclassified Flavobacterium]KOP35997.1 hypothetical protein AKO67_22230 [Flavobacterium sp. VMW]OWU89682.1 hypothetical protein APR43_15930 [Flavobacterium sp. NLM]PUU68309.1 hypothetical protein DBB36_19435 [Flavobacterium sp. WLB]